MKSYCVPGKGGNKVSKCQLLKQCNCNMTEAKNCSCCDQCQLCLQDYYFDCCSCVSLCPVPDDDWDPYVSTVADLTVEVAGLFELLTAAYTTDRRYTAMTYPAADDLNLMIKSDNMGGVKLIADEESVGVPVEGGLEFVRNANCTVAFSTWCKPLAVCRKFCNQMGASKFRWFQESYCCQCVGPTCIGYGPRQPMCANCSGSYEYKQEEEAYDHPVVQAGSKQSGSDVVEALMEPDDEQSDFWDENDQFQKDAPQLMEADSLP